MQSRQHRYLRRSNRNDRLLQRKNRGLRVTLGQTCLRVFNRRTMKTRIALTVLLTGSFISLPLAASIRILEETAIPYTRFLSKAEFDQRFPGEVHRDGTGLAAGWYIFYSQESLRYLFGPVALRATGQDYLGELRTILADVVDQRPALSDHTLRLVQMPYDLDIISGQRAETSRDSSEPKAEEQKKPESSGFWGLLKRLFGF